VLERDHVFPRSIGGTRALAIPSCGNCQREISKAEQEFSRRSVYGLLMAEPGAGPRGRGKRNRPRSGMIQARYVLVPHPLGGYGETAFRSGENPVSLAHVEISPDDLRGNVRGGDPADIQRLVETFKRKLASAPDQNGLVAEIDVFTDVIDEVKNDSAFLPRMVLGLDGDLFIRARSPEEAGKFIRVFSAWIAAGGYKSPGTWKHSEVVSGTTHHVAIRTDQYLVRRVFAKIATGIAILRLGTTFEGLPRLRSYILGEMSERWQEVVDEIHTHGFIKDWPAHNLALVTIQRAQMIGIVSVHGSVHRVDLGPSPVGLNEVLYVAISRKDGTATQWLDNSLAITAAQSLLAAAALSSANTPSKTTD
jgi:hypothetical protein